MRAVDGRPPPEAGRRARGAAAETAIVDAFREILADVGFARLRLEHVAQRAGVSKATLYRRWACKEELAAHLLRQIGEHELSPAGPLVPSTDSLLTGPEVGPVIRGLLCEIANDPVVGEAYRTHVLAQQREAIREALTSRTGGTGATDHDVEREVDSLLARMYFEFIFPRRR